MVKRTSAVMEAETVDRPSANRFRFGYLVHDVSRTRRTLVDAYMRPLGLTRSQWSALSALSRAGNDGLMQVDLARLLEVGKVTIGGLVDRLEATGHVERRADANDRRAKRVFVTPQGWGVIEQLIAVAEKVNKRILNGVSAEELEITERTLIRVKKNIKDALDARLEVISLSGGDYQGAQRDAPPLKGLKSKE